MQISQPSLFARDDTFLGVCAGLGEDFGFNPLFLRIAFAAFLFFNPPAALATYAAAGAIVLLSRWLAPNPRPTAAPRPVAAKAAAGQDDERAAPDRLPIAA